MYKFPNSSGLQCVSWLKIGQNWLKMRFSDSSLGTEWIQFTAKSLTRSQYGHQCSKCDVLQDANTGFYQFLMQFHGYLLPRQG